MESEEEATDVEEAEDASADDGEVKEKSAPAMKFREDMLLRVMEAAGIDVAHRDEFVAFAAGYDHDDNGYLKKAELEDAAKAWNEQHGDGEEASAEEAPAEEETSVEETAEEVPEPEAAPEEAASDAAEEKACMICNTMNAADASVCSACGYTFTE